LHDMATRAGDTSRQSTRPHLRRRRLAAGRGNIWTADDHTNTYVVLGTTPSTAYVRITKILIDSDSALSAAKLALDRDRSLPSVRAALMHPATPQRDAASCAGSALVAHRSPPQHAAAAAIQVARARMRVSVCRVDPRFKHCFDGDKYVGQAMFNSSGDCIGHYRSQRARACEATMDTAAAWGMYLCHEGSSCVSHWMDSDGQQSQWTDRCVVRNAKGGKVTVIFQRELLEQQVPSSFVHDDHDSLSKAVLAKSIAWSGLL
jgi:hypothetical protein